MNKAKYINAEAVKLKVAVETAENKVLRNDSGFHAFLDGFRTLFNKVIDEMQAADVQEIKHGHWIVYQDEGTALCSNCRIVFEDRGDTIPDYWYFCPKCGAKMDGDSND